MGKIEGFKQFVKSNPNLIKYVNNKEMTWQGFYELYDLYGTESSAWEPYINITEEATKMAMGVTGFNEVLNWLKNVDVDAIQSGINSVQRVVGVLQDFTNKETTEPKKEEYRPRPLYKNFED